MVTSDVLFFLYDPVKHLVWLMNYRRNRIKIVSFALIVTS
jgi:hypothetical protein